jgi:hypothetical protein
MKPNRTSLHTQVPASNGLQATCKKEKFLQMKTRRIWQIAAACCLLVMASVSAHAQQGDLKLDLYYNYSNPLGSFKNEYISNSSPRGFAGDIMYNIDRRWGVGLYFGYQDYYQKYPRAVYSPDKNEDISAVVSNSMQTAPVLVKGMFTPLGNSTSFIQPYISAGAGINLITYKQYLGQFGSSESNAKFMAQGGLGIQIPFGRLSNAGLSLGAVFNYVPYNNNGIKNLNSVDFQAGVHFPIR